MATAATNAVEVQLAAVPVPTTVVGLAMLSGCAAAGIEQWPLGLPKPPLVTVELLPPTVAAPPVAANPAVLAPPPLLAPPEVTPPAFFTPPVAFAPPALVVPPALEPPVLEFLLSLPLQASETMEQDSKALERWNNLLRIMSSLLLMVDRIGD